jgi:hypothetical protein
MAKLTLKERLKKQKEEMKSRGEGGKVLYLKEGTTRVRIPPIDDDELGFEVTYFYLNEKLKGIYSASTFDEECPAMEAYHDLKNSKDDDDLELAKKLSPKKAYIIPVVVYSDDKGKSVDKDKSGKLMKIPAGVYQSIIDLYLDEDEWGDMTDPKNGYDIKIVRTGKGKNDTEYSVVACKNTPLDKEYAKKPVNLSKLVRGLIEPYEEVKSKIDQFLGNDDDDDDDKPKKKKKDSKDKEKNKAKAKNDFKAKEEEAPKKKKKIVKKKK